MIGRAQAVAANLIVGRIAVRARRAGLGAAGIAGSYCVVRIDAKTRDAQIGLNLVQGCTADLAIRRIAVGASGAGFRAQTGIDTDGLVVVLAADLAGTAIIVSRTQPECGRGHRAVVLRGGQREPFASLPILGVALRFIHALDGTLASLHASHADIGNFAAHLAAAHFAVLVSRAIFRARLLAIAFAGGQTAAS